MDELIQWALELHAASGVAASVMEKTAKPNFRVADVVSLIERDPALTTRMLTTVNSSRFGLRQKISNLQQAVTLLGQKKLRTIALSFSVVESFTDGVDERIYRDFWRRSLTTSLVADRLSRRFKGIDANDAYIAGLLADIGILAMVQFKPSEYLPIYDKFEHGSELVRAEQAAFGFDHAEFGARLLELWQLPPILSDAVAAHHSEEKSANVTLAQFVLAGNQMPGVLWVSNEADIFSAFDYFERYFEFDIDQFIELAITVNQAVAHEANVFSIGGLEPVSDEVLAVIRERFDLLARAQAS